MKELLNCPNCGAPIEDTKCPYCGSVFIDFASMDMDKPFYLKIKHDGKVMTCKARIDHAELSTIWGNEEVYLYADDRVLSTFIRNDQEHRLDVQMTIVKDDGVFVKEYDLERFRYGQSY